MSYTKSRSVLVVQGLMAGLLISGCSAANHGSTGLARADVSALGVPSLEQSEDTPEPEAEYRWVTVEGGGDVSEQELRVGDVVMLGPIGPTGSPYIYRGEERIEWSYDDGLLVVGGRVVGLRLDMESISQEQVSRYRGELTTIVLRGTGELTPEAVSAVEALAAESGVVLSMVWEGTVPPKLDRLANLGERLLGLHLNGPVGPQTLAHVGTFTSLRSLQLRVRNAVVPDLRPLAALTELRDLDLSGTQVGDSGLTHLSGLTGLRELDLGSTQVGDSGLTQLSGLTELRELDLSDTRVGDAGLAHLSGLTELRRLLLPRTGVSQGPVDTLRQRLPHCDIRR